MKIVSGSPPIRRFAVVLAVIAALMVVALAPVLLTSLILTDQTVDLGESAEHAATIDVADIDENGTVMYTIRPPVGYSTPTNNDVPSPHSLLADADLIKVTIQDDDDLGSSLGHDSEDDCNFTFYLRSDDLYDDQSETFTGFIKLEDDEFWARSDQDRLDECGIIISLDYEE